MLVQVASRVSRNSLGEASVHVLCHFDGCAVISRAESSAGTMDLQTDTLEGISSIFIFQTGVATHSASRHDPVMQQLRVHAHMRHALVVHTPASFPPPPYRGVDGYWVHHDIYTMRICMTTNPDQDVLERGTDP